MPSRLGALGAAASAFGRYALPGTIIAGVADASLNDGNAIKGLGKLAGDTGADFQRGWGEGDADEIRLRQEAHGEDSIRQWSRFFGTDMQSVREFVKGIMELIFGKLFGVQGLSMIDKLYAGDPQNDRIGDDKTQAQRAGQDLDLFPGVDGADLAQNAAALALVGGAGGAGMVAAARAFRGRGGPDAPSGSAGPDIDPPSGGSGPSGTSRTAAPDIEDAVYRDVTPDDASPRSTPPDMPRAAAAITVDPTPGAITAPETPNRITGSDVPASITEPDTSARYMSPDEIDAAARNVDAMPRLIRPGEIPRTQATPDASPRVFVEVDTPRPVTPAELNTARAGVAITDVTPSGPSLLIDDVEYRDVTLDASSARGTLSLDTPRSGASRAGIILTGIGAAASGALAYFGGSDTAKAAEVVTPMASSPVDLHSMGVVPPGAGPFADQVDAARAAEDPTIIHRASVGVDGLYKGTMRAFGSVVGAFGSGLNIAGDTIGIDGTIGYNGDFTPFQNIEEAGNSWAAVVDGYYSAIGTKAPEQRDAIDRSIFAVGEFLGFNVAGAAAAGAVGATTRIAPHAARALTSQRGVSTASKVEMGIEGGMMVAP